MEIALIYCYSTSPQHRGDLREKQPSLSLKVSVACLRRQCQFFTSACLRSAIFPFWACYSTCLQNRWSNWAPWTPSSVPFRTLHVSERKGGNKMPNVSKKIFLIRKEKKLLQQKQDFLLTSPSGRSLLVPVWRRQNTTASAAGKQSAKKMNNNNSFSLFACITRPQFSLQHPVQLVFPLIIINQACSQISLIWAKLTLLGTLLIQWRRQRIRSQKKADKIVPLAFS